MAELDRQIAELYGDIACFGIKHSDTNQYWEDGTPAYRVSQVGGAITLDTGDLAFMTTKRVAPKSAINELLAFTQQCTNSVAKLQSMGVHVWDTQHYPDGTLGKTYGYQYGTDRGHKVYFDKISNKACEALGTHFKLMREELGICDSSYVILSQFEYVIWQLIDNHHSTRIVTDIWNITDLPEMILEPCVFNSQWIVLGDRLNCIVKSRSSDAFLGLPFNLAQWSTLHHLIAHITGYKVGTFEFQFGDVHLYDRHMPAAQAVINNFNKQPELEAPHLEFDEGINWLNARFGENFRLVDYNHHGTIKAPLCTNKKEMEAKCVDKD